MGLSPSIGGCFRECGGGCCSSWVVIGDVPPPPTTFGVVDSEPDGDGVVVSWYSAAVLDGELPVPVPNDDNKHDDGDDDDDDDDVFVVVIIAGGDGDVDITDCTDVNILFQLILTRLRGGPIGGICWVARARNASFIRCGCVVTMFFQPTVSITSVA